MFGGMTSSDFGVDIVATVKANKAAAEAQAQAKLESARAAVMEEAAVRQSVQAAVKAKADAQQEAIEQALQAQDEQREKLLALVAWKKAGGTSAQFDEAWPEMRAAQLKQRVASQAAAQAGATEQFYRRNF